MAEGRVSVNGVTVLELGTKADADADDIRVDGRRVKGAERRRYLLLNKPKGFVSTRSDPQRRPTVLNLLVGVREYVYPVGRLDYDTEGLLLLTNDGALKRRLELPSTGWVRKYRVRARGAPDDAAFEPLRRGITVDGERFAPMSVTIDRQQGANVWLTVGLREGRNREVRRALETLGLSVSRLIRISYGPFQLGDLEPGAVEEIRPKVLREQLGLGAARDAAPSPRGPRRSVKTRWRED